MMMTERTTTVRTTATTAGITCKDDNDGKEDDSRDEGNDGKDDRRGR
jgi:hypothetical protein